MKWTAWLLLTQLSCLILILQYALAEDTLRTGGTGNPKEVSPNELYSQSAIYIAIAHALKPSYSVSNLSMSTIQFLLLPF